MYFFHDKTRSPRYNNHNNSHDSISKRHWPMGGNSKLTIFAAISNAVMPRSGRHGMSTYIAAMVRSMMLTVTKRLSGLRQWSRWTLVTQLTMTARIPGVIWETDTDRKYYNYKTYLETSVTLSWNLYSNVIAIVVLRIIFYFVFGNSKLVLLFETEIELDFLVVGCRWIY